MADLLIHSMNEFSEIIGAAIDVADPRRIVEIGAEFGGTTPFLASKAESAGGELVSIDPAPKQAFLDWCAEHPEVRHIAQPSLAVIDQMADVDAWVIDGDHNWFTVYHELKAIEALCNRDAKPLLVFLHDVCWPCGRRDSYYAPAQIPAEHRQPYDYDGGVKPGNPYLIPHRGFRGMGQFAWAAFEGGEKNGVKTAVEDFAAEATEAGRMLAYAEVPAVFGLGVLFDLDAPWGPEMASTLAPWHENKLLATLERNRLDNYLTVLDWQDNAAGASAIRAA